MTTPPHFRIEAEGYWVLGRLLLGFAATILAQFEFIIMGFVLWAGIAMVICVWLDAITGWYFRRRGPKSPNTSALEVYADVVCFVAAPMELVVALAMSVWPYAFMPLFLLTAVYRLARFQVQGRVEKGYGASRSPITIIFSLWPGSLFISCRTGRMRS